MSLLLSSLIVMAPISQVIGGTDSPLRCPRWVGDSLAEAPEGVGLSSAQKRANLLRCYWAVVKPKERTCLRGSRSRGQVAACEALTARWLQSNFVWQGSPPRSCQPSPVSTPTTLRLNIRSIY